MKELDQRIFRLEQRTWAGKDWLTKWNAAQQLGYFKKRQDLSVPGNFCVAKVLFEAGRPYRIKCRGFNLLNKRMSRGVELSPLVLTHYWERMAVAKI